MVITIILNSKIGFYLIVIVITSKYGIILKFQKWNRNNNHYTFQKWNSINNNHIKFQKWNIILHSKSGIVLIAIILKFQKWNRIINFQN